MGDRHLVVVDPSDTVATAIRELEAGETVTVAVGTEERSIEIAEDVPFGHKIALTGIDAGESVSKYGHSIGDASESIDPGEWVHVHNVESNYGRGDEAETADGVGE
jgi:altronate dehydratase small subunit